MEECAGYNESVPNMYLCKLLAQKQHQLSWLIAWKHDDPSARHQLYIFQPKVNIIHDICICLFTYLFAEVCVCLCAYCTSKLNVWSHWHRFFSSCHPTSARQTELLSYNFLPVEKWFWHSAYKVHTDGNVELSPENGKVYNVYGKLYTKSLGIFIRWAGQKFPHMICVYMYLWY